ncbi:MAG TPA: GNAT family N-acetyltransferase [Dokdonella sp.]|uniref:GNAT family N-acetyltransferase n=1 Tax=Dokdonella sp. TaxID=2291710 RepID=UPI002C8C0DBD|nr:GNAT family N-acetyltransferase [Dokdonella sp.]HUD43492.1 GNAT family N-acetyltransferase [Dokdonella sp.]
MQPDAPPIRIRLARADDDAFVLALAERFVAFELPPWRRRGECLAGIRRELARHLAEQPPGSHLFVAEDDAGTRVGFLHLQLTVDTLSGAANAHICDLAVAPGLDGRGIGSRLLAEAEAWARHHRCRHLTLAVFPGNEAARALYGRRGFGVELLRMVKPL